MRLSHILAVLVQAAVLLSSSVDAFQNAPVGHRPQLYEAAVARSSLSQPRSQLSMAADGETFVDRLTGPKLFKTVTNWNGIHSVPLVPLRIMTGLLMIHHGSEGA